MPTRVIRDGCLDSERIEALSEHAENFYKRLWHVVDDFGRYEYSPVVLLAKAFPRRVHRYNEKQIEQWMRELTTPIHKDARPLVVLYKVGFKYYMELTDFGQRIRPGTVSKWPAPSGELVTLSDPTPLFADFSGENPRDSASRARSLTTSLTTSTDSSSEGGAGGTKRPLDLFDPLPITGVEFRGRAEPIKLPDPIDLTQPSRGATRMFIEWWAVWSPIRGTNHKEFALNAFAAEVTSQNFSDLMECTRSYLAGPGGDPSGGYNPENFIRDQAIDGYQARWPPKKPNGKTAYIDDFRRLTNQDIAEGRA